jgi:hypothetical protein
VQASNIISVMNARRFQTDDYPDTGALEIDHLVPLGTRMPAEAGRGQRTGSETTNDLIDPNHLVAVSASLNRAKEAETPATWANDDRTLTPRPNWCWTAVAPANS